MGGQLQFLLTQLTFKPKPLPSNVRLEGQTAIVTGANVGIGLETARQLASHGVPCIILAVRDVSKGEIAKVSIAASHPNCDIQVWPLELESNTSIIAFASRANSLERLDIAILNAAVKHLTYTTTPPPHSHETNLQVNHLGTALLSLLLLPKLKTTTKQLGKPSRLTFTSSEVHFWTPFPERTAPNVLTHMDDPSSFKPGLERYYTSKLLNVLWFRELSQKVSASDVIINGANPGFVASQLHRHDSSLGFKVLGKVFAWGKEQGGWFLMDAVTKGGESHGGYLQEQKVTKPSAFVLSDEGKEVQKRVWDETVELLGAECPGVELL